MVIIVNYDRYNQTFLDQLVGTVSALKAWRDSQRAKKSKPPCLTVLKVSFSTDSEKRQLEQDLGVTLDEEALMLFKSKGSHRYVNYTFDQFFYDSQYIKNYF